MKHLGMVVLVSLLMLGCAQENTEQDQSDPPSQDGAAQEFRVGEISFSVDSLEAGDGGVTLSVTVANGGSEAISLNRENLEPLLVNDKGDMAFGGLPEGTEVAAGASETFDLSFEGLSGSFFTLTFNAPKDLLSLGPPGDWPVYYVGPILTDGVTRGSQTGSEALDLAVTGDLGDTGKKLEARVSEIFLADGNIVLRVSLSREEGEEVTGITRFAYLGKDCYGPARVSLTDANGTVYVPDYTKGLLLEAPELTVYEAGSEPSRSGELVFAPLLSSTSGPFSLNFNACLEGNPQEEQWSPSLTVANIPLPAQ